MLVGTGNFFLFDYCGAFSHNLSCGFNVLTRDVTTVDGALLWKLEFDEFIVLLCTLRFLKLLL